MAIAAGTHLGRYEIRSLIGAGGMGEVYFAQDTTLRRPVALKVLAADLTQNKERLHRFEQEAFAASSLNHPNILTIHEVGQENGIGFMATEFVDGTTLRQHMSGKALKIVGVLDIAAQIASTLTAAHQAGIVHRDVKPENVMIRRDGIVKVLDFGLAKLAQGQGRGHTSDPEAATQPMVNTGPGVVMGTVAYMSPEQAQALAVDARTDIWSLGVVLYEMLTGRVPFDGSTTSHVIVSILEREPPPLVQYRPEVPQELQRIVRKALNKDREERYQTAKDLLLDLKNLRRELEISAELERSVPPARNSGPTVTATVSSDGQAPAPHVTEKVEAHPTSSAEYVVAELKRHSRGVVIAALLLTLITGGIGYVFHRRAARLAPPVHVPFQNVRMTKLSTNGKVAKAAISPDGKYVAYVESDAGRQGLWVKQVSTESTVQLVPPEAVTYQGVTFSHGGDRVHYVTQKPNEEMAMVYQVPVLGGAPKKLLADVDSAITFSPDGKQIAYVRNAPEESALWVANSDGSAERKLCWRQPNEYFSHYGPSWSSDGKTIACAAMVANASNSPFSMNVFAVQVESGEEKPVSTKNWQWINDVAWLADGNGMLLAGRRGSNDQFQIWHVPYPVGEPRQITNDMSNYTNFSLSRDGGAIVTAPTTYISNIWVTSVGDFSRAQQVTSGKSEGMLGLSWTPDHKVVYASAMDVILRSIWIMETDGSAQKQLTTTASAYRDPAVSPDGRSIVFLSTRSGNFNVWRMDADGSNLKQLTSGTQELDPRWTPDGQWVVYGSVELGRMMIKLWKMPSAGGDPVQLTEAVGGWHDISPDGKLIAYYNRDQQSSQPYKIVVSTMDGGLPVRMFDVSNTVTQSSPLRWTPDGRALSYIDVRGGAPNVWSQPVEGGPPRQLTEFREDQIFSFDWSRDGKRLALARGRRPSDLVLITEVK